MRLTFYDNGAQLFDGSADGIKKAIAALAGYEDKIYLLDPQHPQVDQKKFHKIKMGYKAIEDFKRNKITLSDYEVIGIALNDIAKYALYATALEGVKNWFERRGATVTEEPDGFWVITI